MSHNVSLPEIKHAKLFAYQLPFKTPIAFKQYQLQHREGLILQLTDKNNINNFVEIAPLPGFSSETFAQVKQELLQILPLKITNLSTYKSRYPSVQFALDSLSYDRKNINQTGLFNTDNIALLQGNSESIIEQYQQLASPGIVKLKVARELVEIDITNFQKLCQLNPHLKIRCDANQIWNKHQAEQFFSAINIEQLDYIEEPTSNHLTNLSLAQKYQFKLGLDETLQQADFNYQHHETIKAFVIKPTIIGNKQKIDQLVSVAQQKSIQVSISSSFESIVGLIQLKALAASYLLDKSNQHLAINLGIDTLKYFKSSLLIEARLIEKDCQKLELLWTKN